MRNIQNVLTILLLSLLTACSYTHIGNRDNAYLTAQSIPPLQIPPGLSSDSISEDYPVADRSYSHAPVKPNLIPPELH